MPEPPGQNNFRSPYPSGQLAQRPDQPVPGQQPIMGNYPNTGTGYNNNNNNKRITGALSPKALSPYATKPLLDRRNGAQPPSTPNNGFASGASFPQSPPNTPPRQNWGLPPEVATRAKKRRLIQRARNRYERLSMPKKIIALVLIIALLLPSLLTVFEVINGAILYSQVRSGLGHLQAVQTIFSGANKDDYAAYFEPEKLRQAQTEIQAAHSDFATLSDEFDHDGSIGFVGSLLPSQIHAARSLTHIATDATVVGDKLISTAIKHSPSIVKTLNESAANKDTDHPKPYITEEVFTALNQDLDTLMPVFRDMSNYSQGVSLDGLPISESQSHTISSALALLPTINMLLEQGPSVRNAFGWLIGVDQPRTFLLEPMDSAELRSTGGFTGQFGELTFSGGHMNKLKMKNIGAYEEDHSQLDGGSAPIDEKLYAKVVQQSAPDGYQNWWPIENFGVRDATVSADFPTTAKIIMQYYQGEFGTPLSGVILFTPTLIKQILHVIGPIKIAEYGETVTEQNLEDKLHFYQLDNKGIGREIIIEHIKDAELARKAFTQRVTQALMASVMHLPVAQLAPMGAQMFQSMKTKDLQVYVNNPQLQDLIAKYGSTVSMDRSNSHDGLYVVQSNISANKASQYVSTAIKDTVTLDQQGNATHAMTMVLDYQKKGDIYGPDTYRDYVRVYAPKNSTLIKGNGFFQPNLGAVCGSPDVYQACSQDVYNNGTLVCSSPTVNVDSPIRYLPNLGPGGAYLGQVGDPPNTTSDEDGRAMFGGWVVIPPNCKMTVTLSWTVPAMGQNDYSLMFQPQASVAPKLDLTVKSPACSAGDNHFAGTMNGQDSMFKLTKQGSSCSLQRK
ncbi:hypothetical protein KDA_36520 [Dictyobacter alpinus]|uniref:DUF4012 domain-containing protein n=1 Tax=Dictyobacter alpinus TaxID=2014873 RepID=A0A402B9X0_9CHLR|nr:DUF4012 domain-containing protein [Dictyobacter alpinus]GCE28168.1 hypothetical protein KDA_36520 [Dictyobacter alpinus]